MTRFAGKTVLITGGTSGIGLAVAKRIAAEGGRVGVTGTNPGRLESTRAALPAGSLVVADDAGKPDAGPALADAVKGGLGSLDGLFLNAGYGVFAPAEAVDAAHFDPMMNVNVRGAALHMAALKPLVKPGASIVVTSSVANYMGMPAGAVYSATKSAILTMSKSWAREMAGDGVRVNAVSPGPIDTNFFAGMGLSEQEVEGFSEQVKAQVPLGRFGSADEVAAVVTFLLSDDAAYVTGSEYMVDGGMTMR